MLFFRSEERIRDWCRARHLPVRPHATLGQLWGLAVGFYGTRLQPDFRRPNTQEVRRTFDGVGLTEPFWDPASTAS